MSTTLMDTIKNIDNRLFAGKLRKLNRLRWKFKVYRAEKPYLKQMYTEMVYNKNMCFASKQQNFLGALLDKYGSGKGLYLYDNNQVYVGHLALHLYNDIYSLLFFQHKKKTTLVLECGIGTKNPNIPSNMSLTKYTVPGGSLRAWRDYFPNADIIGIDIDSDIMFTEDRISTYVCDQTKPSSINNFIQQASLQPNTVDIIIDDGLHEFNANITLFENTKHLLKDNGVYIIEDYWVISKEQQQYINYFNNLSGYEIVFIKTRYTYLIVLTKKDV